MYAQLTFVVVESEIAMVLEQVDKDRLVKIVTEYPGYTVDNYISMAFPSHKASMRGFEQEVHDFLNPICMSFWGNNPTRRCLFMRYKGM